MFSHRWLLHLGALLLAIAALPVRADGPVYFGIRVIDPQSGRGIPLVELRTVSNVVYITDSAGLAAFHEPGLMHQRVFFHVRSHGYEMPGDGFGQRGVQLETTPGKIGEIRLPRVNLAERLYRLTGEGIYRDSILLGQPVPIQQPLLNAQVAGQDSAQVAIYRGLVHWFWGDTLRPKYPLGNYWMSGATAPLPGKGGLNPRLGIDYRYFTNAEGCTRPMWPPTDASPIWSDGFMAVADEHGRERLVAHYCHMKDLSIVLDHGLSVFDDEQQVFQNVRHLPLAEKWRCPSGHPLRADTGDGDHFHFPANYDLMSPFPTVRVRARYEEVLAPDRYEAFTPISDGAVFTGADTLLLRGDDGRPRYRWTGTAPPLTPAQERALVATGLLQADEAHFQPTDVETGKPIELHGGSVFWNPYLHRWLMIAVQKGGSTSHLGEVWAGVADRLTGPWRQCRRILTHDRYTFYNPVHHPFLDEADGRFIHFEGTYTHSFSGQDHPTPRYDYNQIIYRLDLADPRLPCNRLNLP